MKRKLIEETCGTRPWLVSIGACGGGYSGGGGSGYTLDAYTHSYTYTNTHSYTYTYTYTYAIADDTLLMVLKNHVRQMQQNLNSMRR